MEKENTIEERVASLENRLEKIEKQFGKTDTVVAPKGKKLSAKEFLMTKDIGTETQKVLALSYFLEHIEGKPAFNVPDLESMFRLAKEKIPKNINDAVNKNIARGFLMEAEEI